MSVLSFLGGLLKGFVQLFKKVEPEVRSAIKVSSDITDAIKNIDPNEKEPLAIVLAVIPEGLKSKFMDTAAPILFNAGLIDDPNTPTEEAIWEASENIRQLKGTLHKKVLLNNLGIFLTDVLADGKIGWDDLVHIPKLFFSHRNDDEIVQALDDELPPTDPPTPPPPGGPGH